MEVRTWVDFRLVKQQVTLAMALEHYGVNWLRKNGDELRGRCPIHKGEGDRTFHVNPVKGAFKCFSCKAKGNVLDFVAAMEECGVRDAAVKLAEWFKFDRANNPQRETARPAPKAQNVVAAPVNPRLGFQLKVDTGHEYGTMRGLSSETLKTFGAGYCQSKGTFAGRFVIPLHDTQGELVGYAGRSLDDSEPKYLFPSSEKGFQKRHLLFNWHRVIDTLRADHQLVIVEGFFDCMKVTEAGFPCVALMGSSLSEEQADLIGANVKRVILLLDGDEPGKAAATECSSRLAEKAWVRTLSVPVEIQPDQMSTADLKRLLTV